VQISIVDNGIGFDKNDANKLCEPFIQLKKIEMVLALPLLMRF
jgi:signal transduction histidine kinase